MHTPSQSAPDKATSLRLLRGRSFRPKGRGLNQQGRLINSLGYTDRGKLQAGHTNVISLALAQLEQILEKPSQPLRYGLVMLNENRRNNE